MAPFQPILAHPTTPRSWRKRGPLSLKVRLPRPPPTTDYVFYLARQDNWYVAWDNTGSLCVTVCR